MISHTGFLHRTLFSSLLWRMPGKKIFLTFDDGPHPAATPAVLDTLRRHNIRGTFFLSGKNIPGNEAVVRRIYSEGHSVGIHAYQHTRLLAFSQERTQREIRETQNLLASFSETPARLFRPPFGFFSWNTIAAARETGCVLVMWSCLTGDFRNWRSERIVRTALHRISGGDILVFHDNHLTAHRIAGILDETIEGIRTKGFAFGAIR